MDVFTILSYLNKVSLIAFVITTAVVGYQIYIFKKEKTKEHAPSIPDFKENNNFAVASNYTSLPSYLTKKQIKSVNYSKSIFLTISLLTVIVVIFVVSLIKKNSVSPNNQTAKNSSIKATITPSTVKPTALPTSADQKNLTPTPKPTEVVPTEILPTKAVAVVTLTPIAEPTEIVLANNPDVAEGGSPTEAPVSQPQVLPETGSVGKVLLIIGVAFSTIFFSFFL